jgi:hypothetical protein
MFMCHLERMVLADLSQMDAVWSIGIRPQRLKLLPGRNDGNDFPGLTASPPQSDGSCLQQEGLADGTGSL